MYNSNQIFRIPRQDEDQLLDVYLYLANFKKLLVDAHVKKFVLFTTSPIGMYFHTIMETNCLFFARYFHNVAEKNVVIWTHLPNIQY